MIYIEIKFENGETYHIKDKDVQKLRKTHKIGLNLKEMTSRNILYYLHWNEIEEFCVRVDKNKPFHHNLNTAKITLKEVN